MERLYASVASALLLSFPIQIVSFVLWKKRSYRKTSRNIRTIPPRNYLWLVPLFAALWGGFFWLFSAVGSSNTILDNTIFILGIFSSFFLMLGISRMCYQSGFHSSGVLALDDAYSRKYRQHHISAVLRLFAVPAGADAVHLVETPPRTARCRQSAARRSKRGGNKGGKVGVKSFFTEQ